MEKKIITAEQVSRLRNRLWTFIGVMSALFVATLIVPVDKSAASAKLICDSAIQQLGQYLFFSPLQCLDVSFYRLAVYAVLFLLAGWMASAMVGEKGWIDLLRSIFTANGDNSPMLTLIFITVFFWVTAYDVHYTSLPNFLVSVAFFISRNSLMAMLFIWLELRILHWTRVRELGSIEAYLVEQTTEMSDGLTWFHALALLTAYFFPRVFGG